MSRLVAGAEYPRLAIVFLTFDRSDLLTDAYTALIGSVRTLSLPTETIISDDASAKEHQLRILELGADRVLVAPRNRGLGNNHNKALAACTAAHVLVVQDDWRFVGPPQLIRDALSIFDEDEQIGIVNFLPPSVRLPCVRRHTQRGVAYDVYENDGQRRVRSSGLRPYSDRPHVKSRTFIDSLGPYLEAVPMTHSELEFQQRVACQTRWRVAWIHGATAFEHLGADRSFNPGQLRHERLARLEKLPLIGPALRLARPLARRWLRAGHAED